MLCIIEMGRLEAEVHASELPCIPKIFYLSCLSDTSLGGSGHCASL